MQARIISTCRPICRLTRLCKLADRRLATRPSWLCRATMRSTHVSKRCAAAQHFSTCSVATARIVRIGTRGAATSGSASLRGTQTSSSRTTAGNATAPGKLAKTAQDRAIVCQNRDHSGTTIRVGGPSPIPRLLSASARCVCGRDRHCLYRHK